MVWGRGGDGGGGDKSRTRFILVQDRPERAKAQIPGTVYTTNQRRERVMIKLNWATEICGIPQILPQFPRCTLG